MTLHPFSETANSQHFQPEFALEKGFRFGEWNVFPSENLLIRGNQRVRLEPRIMQLLLALVANHDKPCTRDQLLDQLWPSLEAAESSLTRGISVLRRALGDQRHPARYIYTVQRIGYKAIAPIQPLEPIQPYVKVEGPATPLNAAGETMALARYLIARGNGPDLLHAIEILSDFADREPYHADVFALLAHVQQIIHLYCDEPAALRSLQFNAHTQEALRLDSANGLAWAALAKMARNQWRWHEAIEHYKRAIRFSPRDPNVLFGQALLLLHLGHIEAAQEVMLSACQLQPMAGCSRMMLAWMLMHGKPEQAQLELIRAKQLGADSIFTDNLQCLLYHRAGWIASSIPKWNRINRQRQDDPLWLWPKYLLHALSDEPSRANMIRIVRERVATASLDPGAAMFMLATVGALDAAFEMADHAIASRSFFIIDPWLQEMDAFRADDRFSALLPKLGLNDTTLAVSAPIAATRPN